ncbi:MAG: endonuclease/exonuclease/phosphatase family protein [Proteobacteria bacterium]|nr:endonuclease/exonuclease/phosphatase family protein [Pseudomonadota bacterium]
MQDNLKLMTLNIWGGHVESPLLGFIENYKGVDIFCLQEVYKDANAQISTEDRSLSLNIYSKIQGILKNHNGYFSPVVDGVYGLATFVKKDIEVMQYGQVKIHDNPNYIGKGPTHSRIMQNYDLKYKNTEFTVLNVHGLWNGNGKTDSPERIIQSNKIKDFVNKIDKPLILCGDFNLAPDTNSLKIVEDGMIDLVANNNILSTRTVLYPGKEKYADYIFCSYEIKILDFSVLPDVVSDHRPLLVKFGL